MKQFEVNMKKFLAFSALLALAFAALAATKEVVIPFKQFKLKNGLTVILSEDHSAPTYSIAVSYNVGSRNEKEGRTGFAHLFEHMMFQGSENVAKTEHSTLISTNGGSLNGTTDEDRTLYFESLPANQLDLGLFLEADRMRSLAVTQANLDNQRNAVQEERRLRVDNQPYGKTFEAVNGTAYDNFAYRHSVIGSMEDLNAASLQDVQDFFKRYYAPNNAVVAIVGDFKSDEVMAKMNKYFGEIPAQPAPPQPDMAEPAQTAERRKTLEDSFAQLPRIDIVYKIPAGDTADFYALRVMSQILSAGQSSRMYQHLVKEQELAQNAFAGANSQRGPGLEQLGAMVRPGKDIAAVEKALYAEVAKIQTEPATDEEMEKVHMIARRSQVANAQSSLNRAIELADATVNFGNTNMVNETYQKTIAVTKADVMRVAKKYLTENNRTVIITLPKKAQ
ncbi:MAG TPA: pitrilysin family protein [Candidatus Sulfopaludibacter sp.]|jgi:predicted Zn-dependent peptidase|nr:pitrilysin family protein [Candidatus Sulfopaludibacter sp.]